MQDQYTALLKKANAAPSSGAAATLLKEKQYSHVLFLQTYQLIGAVSYKEIRTRHLNHIEVIAIVFEDCADDHFSYLMKFFEAEAERRRFGEVLMRPSMQNPYRMFNCGYFPIRVNEIPNHYRTEFSTIQGPYMLHKRLPLFFRDRVLPLTPTNLVQEIASRTEMENTLRNFQESGGLLDVEQRLLECIDRCNEKEIYQEAQYSDQAITPWKIKKAIARLFGVRQSHFWDPCPFDCNWNAEYSNDALTQKWAGDLIYLNHPWSKSFAFFPRMFAEYVDGASVACLVAYMSCCGDFFTNYILPKAITIKLFPVKFSGGFKEEFRYPLMLVLLL